MDAGTTINAIIEKNARLVKFWSCARGWAPADAATILETSRLDWQLSLAHSLKLWIEPPSQHAMAGHLILAWTNLGSLVEGTLKLFLCAFLTDYAREPHKRRGEPVLPDVLTLEELRQFFNKNVWLEQQRARWDQWLSRVQQRRNAIHAFRDRELGTYAEFHQDIQQYLGFVTELDAQLPYPDYGYP